MKMIRIILRQANWQKMLILAAIYEISSKNCQAINFQNFKLVNWISLQVIPAWGEEGQINRLSKGGGRYLFQSKFRLFS